MPMRSTRPFGRCDLVSYISEKSQTNAATGDAPLDLRPRFTLAGRTVLIALRGMTFPALRLSSPHWALPMVSLTIRILLGSIVAILLHVSRSPPTPHAALAFVSPGGLFGTRVAQRAAMANDGRT